MRVTGDPTEFLQVLEGRLGERVRILHLPEDFKEDDLRCAEGDGIDGCTAVRIRLQERRFPYGKQAEDKATVEKITAHYSFEVPDTADTGIPTAVGGEEMCKVDPASTSVVAPDCSTGYVAGTPAAPSTTCTQRGCILVRGVIGQVVGRVFPGIGAGTPLKLAFGPRTRPTRSPTEGYGPFPGTREAEPDLVPALPRQSLLLSAAASHSAELLIDLI